MTRSTSAANESRDVTLVEETRKESSEGSREFRLEAPTDVNEGQVSDGPSTSHDHSGAIVRVGRDGQSGYWWPVALFLVLGVVGVGGFLLWQPGSGANADDQETAGDSRLAVSVSPLEPHATYQRRIAYTGTVRARRSASLGFELGGRVSEVLVDEGSEVVADQVLARLDRKKLDASRAEIAAALAGAQAQLAEAQAGPRQKTIAVAEQRVAELEADVELAQLTFNRVSQLRRTDASSQRELEQATFTLQAALARLESARMNLDELEEGTRQEQIAAAQATVDRFAAQLAELDLQIEDCDIKAPFAGVVTRRWLDEGTIVSPGA